tara:strand:+ start:82034 stop:84592 length:2559 start_codon:yes stop_codon:yes gene_type:complete
MKLFEEFNYIEFKNTGSYVSGDYHQAIMDVGYNAWQKSGDVHNGDEMFDYMETHFGGEFKMMIQIGNYNQQVGNGGHSQYWSNGYASKESGGAMNSHQECGILSEMIESIEGSLLSKKYPIVNKVLKIMTEFESILEEYDERCEECEGQGYFENDCYNCEDGKIEEPCNMCDGDECEECGGNGTTEEDCYDCDGQGYTSDDCEYCDGGYNSLEVFHLDTPYYELEEEFMEACNDFSKKLIDNFYNVQTGFKKMNEGVIDNIKNFFTKTPQQLEEIKDHWYKETVNKEIEDVLNRYHIKHGFLEDPVAGSLWGIQDDYNFDFKGRKFIIKIKKNKYDVATDEYFTMVFVGEYLENLYPQYFHHSPEIKPIYSIQELIDWLISLTREKTIKLFKKMNEGGLNIGENAGIALNIIKGFLDNLHIKYEIENKSFDSSGKSKLGAKWISFTYKNKLQLISMLINGDELRVVDFYLNKVENETYYEKSVPIHSLDDLNRELIDLTQEKTDKLFKKINEDISGREWIETTVDSEIKGLLDKCHINYNILGDSGVITFDFNDKPHMIIIMKDKPDLINGGFFTMVHVSESQRKPNKEVKSLQELTNWLIDITQEKTDKLFKKINEGRNPGEFRYRYHTIKVIKSLLDKHHIKYKELKITTRNKIFLKFMYGGVSQNIEIAYEKTLINYVKFHTGDNVRNVKHIDIRYISDLVTCLTDLTQEKTDKLFQQLNESDVIDFSNENINSILFEKKLPTLLSIRRFLDKHHIKYKEKIVDNGGIFSEPRIIFYFGFNDKTQIIEITQRNGIVERVVFYNSALLSSDDYIHSYKSDNIIFGLDDLAKELSILTQDKTNKLFKKLHE